MKKFYGLTALFLAILICGGSAFACDAHKGTKDADSTKTESTE